MNKINKGFLCLVLILLQAQTLQAQDSRGITLTSDGRFPLNDGLCGTVIYTLAQSTMLKRQDGASISEMVANASKSDKLFGFNDTVRDMTLASYERESISKPYALNSIDTLLPEFSKCTKMLLRIIGHR